LGTPTTPSSQLKMPLNGEYMNFQMNAAETRGSRTGTISRTPIRLRMRPCTFSNR
jgi:hypothetical protein